MPAEPPSAASRLCAECGMCCDGVLFHGVDLQPGDSERALSALGLKIKRRGRAPYAVQPCPAHRGCRCAIYDQRPVRCRVFNCRQLLRAMSGEITESTALEKIREARKLVTRVNTLIDRAGGANPLRALAQRFANVMTGPPPDEQAVGVREELAAAMRELRELLERDFRMPE